MRLVIASRKSDLARIQAYAVGQQLQKKHPHLKIEYHFRESLGDKNLNDPLWKMPERGVFTEDFYQGLVGGEWDVVVHSWKDLPVEVRAGTELIASLPREDMRDVLLFKKSVKADQRQIRILTSSPRRNYNLTNCLKNLLPYQVEDLAFLPVRGNVQTRVKKLLEGDADGLIVAKAALDRLLGADQDEFRETKNFLRDSLRQLRWMVLPLSLNPTAAAQGALAIEVRSERDDLKKLFEPIHCQKTFSAVQEEREQLKAWGGGCHQKIGISIFHRPFGKVTWARGLRDSGETIDIQNVQRQRDWQQGEALLEAEKSQWFDRQPLENDYKNLQINAHWVSKAEALPLAATINDTDLVWTSGVLTWQRLARRGIWVNGSSESLGEREDMRIVLLDGQQRQWGKWTHSGGSDFSLGKIIKSYSLVPKKTIPLYKESCRHFYWMSGSSFKEAIKHYPWLLDRDNWCGAGNTHDIISDVIKNHKGQGAARIALNLEEWQKLMKQGT